MSAQYVRGYYRVPAKKGGRVVFDGKPGRITGFAGQYVLVRLDGDPMTGRPLRCHPTWRMEYVPSGRDAPAGPVSNVTPDDTNAAA